ncbi:MAG: hypothetical protein HYT08_04345 [Candidatus Levybacteria bacterium]|nr:hypothetical protein [Candidatus Levybacteria bacterium]
MKKNEQLRRLPRVFNNNHGTLPDVFKKPIGTLPEVFKRPFSLAFNHSSIRK